jgi:hypothetical protein
MRQERQLFNAEIRQSYPEGHKHLSEVLPLISKPGSDRAFSCQGQAGVKKFEKLFYDQPWAASRNRSIRPLYDKKRQVNEHLRVGRVASLILPLFTLCRASPNPKREQDEDEERTRNLNSSLE